MWSLCVFWTTLILLVTHTLFDYDVCVRGTWMWVSALVTFTTSTQYGISLFNFIFRLTWNLTLLFEFDSISFHSLLVFDFLSYVQHIFLGIQPDIEMYRFSFFSLFTLLATMHCFLDTLNHRSIERVWYVYKRSRKKNDTKVTAQKS